MKPNDSNISDLSIVHLSLSHTTAGEHVGLSGVDSDAADVVGVGLEHVDSLQRVVVERSDHHVILRTERPVD